MYKLLLLDIDGTLRPHNMSEIPSFNVDAVRAVQAEGIRVAVATGRSMAGVPQRILNGLSPDYWICASGGQIFTGAGELLYERRMRPEQVNALIGYMNSIDRPFGFSFSDGVYIYRHYDLMHERERNLGAGSADFINGEDQSRHKGGLPVAGFCRCYREDTKGFTEKYPDLGLRFLFYGLRDHLGMFGCDILQPGQDKEHALKSLALILDISLSECAAAGDGENDVGMLRAAGAGFAMENGAHVAIDAADYIIPSVDKACEWILMTNRLEKQI